MKIVINLLLLLAVAALGYLLFDSIREPIEFQSAKTARKAAVVERLNDIRECQEIYRTITGEFAPSFDTLEQVLTEGQIPFVQVTGDPNDPDNEEKFIYKTLYTPAIDSVSALNIKLDSLRYVPYAVAGTQFDIDADTTTYQKTLVPVTMVSTRYNKFMGKFANARFAKYDNSYDPNAIIRFGSMDTPNLSGNW